MNYKIVLDAGHGGYDFGSVYGNRIEKEETLKLVLAIGEILENAGIEILYTRTYDKYITPTIRAQIANEENAHLFVSVHKNHSDNPNTYSGVQTIVSDPVGIQYVIADNIHRKLNETGFDSIGIDAMKNVDVLKKTKMPAFVIKLGFINTEADNLIVDKEFNSIAEMIASGILEVVGSINSDEIKTYTYRVQVGDFRVLSNAIKLQRKLIDMGYPVYLSKRNEYYIVSVGEYYNEEEANAILYELNQKGIEGFVVAL